MSRLAALCLLLPGLVRAEDPPTGFQPRVAVRRPTGLDWQFVASGFGQEETKEPRGYDSRRQAFQLHIPRGYRADRAWPLIVFVSPDDAPIGWKRWQKVCESQNAFYCEAYMAGNSCPPGRRVRIILDMLFQVRADFRIDPDRTYISGFSGGGRIACTVGYALPELFGGIAPLCGTNPLSSLDYLRHRAQDRLSVAFVTGEKDFNRVENEKYMVPFVKELEVRTRLWVVPGLAHAIPGDAVLAEVKRWLDDDLSRRQADIRKRPSLACPTNDALDPASQAVQLLTAAQADFKDDARTWRGVTLLQGILQRFPRTESGAKARKLLDELKEDERRLKLAGDQGGEEERKYLLAQAQAFERFDKKVAAVQAFKLLSQQHPDSPEGHKAIAALRRLAGGAAQVSLGIGLAGESTTVEKVAPDSPADRAGLLPGDRLRTLNDIRVMSFEDVKRVLKNVAVGDRVRLTIDRKGKIMTITLEIKDSPN